MMAKFMSEIIKIPNFNKSKISQMEIFVNVFHTYLESVMITKDFKYQRNILTFVKMQKERPLSSLPPSLFDLINTIVVCKMSLFADNLEKVRGFISYWLEKIEMETVEEEEYEDSKYLLRNTLCSILSQLGDHEQCLRVANFNMKEIASEVTCDKFR